jgi:hypothetical protein
MKKEKYENKMRAMSKIVKTKNATYLKNKKKKAEIELENSKPVREEWTPSPVVRPYTKALQLYNKGKK